MGRPFFVNIMPSSPASIAAAPRATREYAQQSARAGFRHTLITVGDKRLDPWMVAQDAVAVAPGLSPLIAVNPLYQHPLHVAKKVTTWETYSSALLALNLVSGSFFSEMKALHDDLDFAARNRRLTEFTQVLAAALSTEHPLDFTGEFYTVTGASL